MRALPVAGVYALAPGLADLATGLADLATGARVPLVPSLLNAAGAAVVIGTLVVVLFVDRSGLPGRISGAQRPARADQRRAAGGPEDAGDAVDA